MIINKYGNNTAKSHHLLAWTSYAIELIY